MKLTRLISAGCALTFAAIASAGGLSIGDQAPDLGKDVTWVKGESVTEFEEGKIYVLDFWATWCGPCIRAIPHMDELAEKHESDGVTVIGVAIWPRPSMTPTVDYVADRGDEMSYTIASDIDGATAQKFMNATGSNGIPTVMIVDRDGVLAWLGHPMDGMDEALAQIIAGTYDIEGAAKANKRKAMLAEKAAPLMAKANEAYQAGDWKTVVTSLQELAEIDPEQYGAYAVQAFDMMITKLNDEHGAYDYAKKMVKGAWSDQPMALNALAWTIVDSDAIKHRDLDLAYKAAKKANSLTGDKDPMILDTLAAVYYQQGEIKKAIKTQQRAIANADAAAAKELKASLDKYMAAANEG